MIRSLVLTAALLAAAPAWAQERTPPLEVSDNGRYLEAGGEPFFWLGDTGWLMLSRLTREETEHYLATRAAKGFNVIQVMVLHSPDMSNRYDASALHEGDPSRPRTTPGSDPEKPGEYDFWDHLDWAVERAAAHGIYLALVPAWGSVADAGKLNPRTAPVYARFLAERYKDDPNIVWLNGGDTPGDRNTETWNIMGRTIKAIDPNHLMTFHPFGRTDSSWTFHNEPWLDFNMFQSGHRTYAQDDTITGRGEDNWRYVASDWVLTPVKPTIDGEPSYENIPHGLHEADQPRWGAAGVRRYAWWAVFAGAFGHSYGENSVMQMYVPGRYNPSFHAEHPWTEVLDAPGATQMRHVKALMLSRPYFERVPDQTLIAGENGARYDRVIATRGEDYAMAYTFTGRPFSVNMGKISGDRVNAAWYDPRTGGTRVIGTFANKGVRRFTPPGTPEPGNDWVLLLDDVAAGRK